MAEPWTAAWEEAEAICPSEGSTYVTLELQHPAFLEAGVPVALRFVLDVQPRQLGIEAGAAFDAGTVQEFAPIAFSASRPEVAEGQAPQCKISIDNVADDLTEHMEAAVAVRADLTLIYREYRTDDVSEPCYGPVEFQVRQARMTGTRIDGVAKLADLVNTKFPRMVYSRAEYPALAA